MNEEDEKLLELLKDLESEITELKTSVEILSKKMTYIGTELVHRRGSKSPPSEEPTNIPIKLYG